MVTRNRTIELQSGDIISNKYYVERLLGSGWEGQVYLVREKKTGIKRAIKLFYPKRNKRNFAIRKAAKKLDILKNCPGIVQYHTQDEFEYAEQSISYLVSEYVEGEMLSMYLKRQAKKRLHPFQAMHLIYALTNAIAHIHKHKMYHGDLHTDNVMVRHCGMSYDIKILDLAMQSKLTPSQEQKDDVYRIVEILYEAIGGKKGYRDAPPLIKALILGKNREKILKKFPTVDKLKKYMETACWE